MAGEKSLANGEAMEVKEERLLEKLKKIAELEKEVLKREKALKARDGARKQIVLRLAPGLWDDIAAWAEEDFRSINGQIEYLLSDCVKRKKTRDNSVR